MQGWRIISQITAPEELEEQIHCAISRVRSRTLLAATCSRKRVSVFFLFFWGGWGGVVFLQVGNGIEINEAMQERRGLSREMD